MSDTRPGLDALREAVEAALILLWHRRRGPGADDLPPDMSADAAVIAHHLNRFLASPATGDSRQSEGLREYRRWGYAAGVEAVADRVRAWERDAVAADLPAIHVVLAICEALAAAAPKEEPR